MPATDHVKAKVRKLPHKPGVYLMKDRFGTVIYVGKARDLRKRVSQYFHPSRRQGWDLKFNALVDAIHDLDTHTVKNEAEALLLEGKLIKEFQPRYNISFRDDKRFLLLKVNLKDPIPRFTLTRLKQEDGARYFGPFASSGSVRRTMQRVRKKFSLRGCRPLNPTEHDYKHCLYAHLKNCTAPCIGNIDREGYLAQVEAACEFLDGQTGEMVEEMEAEMKKAAADLDFEKAAQLRDAIKDIHNATQKNRSFARVPYTLPVAVNPDDDLVQLAEILQLEKGPYRIEGYDISNISGTLQVSSMVSFRNGRPDRNAYRRFRMKTVKGQDDFACMAETIKRRYTRLRNDIATFEELSDEDKAAYKKEPPHLPSLILIDGGKGQLNAACAELAKLNLSHLPIIGLAKEFEEIYRPGEKDPLRIPHDQGALKLLQRVRDESHRFANTYNAQLRLKKISESLLDEFPGIGDARKKALLKKFGSVHRMRLATIEQIAEVEGFGEKSATALREFLLARQDREPETTASDNL